MNGSEKKTKVQDILKTIKLGKWTWGDHVARRTDGRWTTAVTEWTQRTGKRSQGRPVQEMESGSRQVLGDACLDRTYKEQKIMEKTC